MLCLADVEADPTLRALIERCRTSSEVQCTGVPPLSCDAFGRDYQVRSTDSERCVRCPDLAVSLALQFSIAAVFLVLVVAYIKFISDYQRMGEKLDLWAPAAAPTPEPQLSAGTMS